MLARSNIYLSDVQSFRSMFGLKANDPQFIITNSDPGILRGFDSIETTLDTEWAGAVAPAATINVVISASAGGSDGIDLSAMYAVTKNVSPIISVSYGACESQLGATALAFYNSLWKQASAQGQTVLVASGDSGAAGCDLSSAATAKRGKGVNGLCSSPYATCVGGTQFAEGANPGIYWMPTSPGSNAGSALGYIPETAWNESGTVAGGGGVAATGGGASITYPKPAWQVGPGVPADGQRNVPDVSLTAASHDGYTVVQGGMLGYIFGVSGTSASTPSLAGMIALVNQKTKSAQGNINPILYSLAAKQAAGGAAVFHDIRLGDNSVPGQAGFAATAGYDQATGLGSVDANLLATVWYSTTDKAPALSVFGGVVTVNAGQAVTTTVTTVLNGAKSAVALSVTGLPTGVTAAFTLATVASPGSGKSALKLTAAANAIPGIYTLTLKATAGTQTATSNFELTITTPTFTLNNFAGLYPSVNFGPTVPFASQTVKLQTLPANGFNSPIALTATGLPAGMTVAFSPAIIPAGGVGNSVATFSLASTVKGGQYPFTINAIGGGVTQSVKYSANVMVQPSCAATADQNSISFKAGATAVITLTCTSAKPNTTPVTLSVTGAPGGVTAQFSSSTISSGKTVKLTLTSTAAVTPGTYPLTFTGSEASGAKQNFWVYAAISTPVFSLSFNPTAVSGLIGSTTQFVALVTPEPGFNAPVTVWIGGRPNGVTATFTPAPAGSLGNTITLTIDKTAVAGVYPLTIGASANTGFSRTVTSTLTLTAPQPLAISSSAPTATLKVGGSTQVTLTSKSAGTFNSAVALAAAGLPVGVTAKFSAPTVAAPGNGTVTLTLTSASTAKAGTSAIRVTGTGGGKTASATVNLTITP